MTITLPPDALEVRVTHPGDGYPAFEIPDSDVLELTAKHKAGKEKGTGGITIDNDGWKYTTGDDETQVGIGDRITVLGYAGPTGSDPFGEHGHETGDERSTVIGHGDYSGASDAAFGTGGFGTGEFGTGTMENRGLIGTYLVEDWQIIEHAPGQSDLVLEIADYVFARLEKTTPFYGAEGRPISGFENAIVNEILEEYAPEISRRHLTEIPETTDYYVNGSKNGREVLDDVAKIAAQLHGPIVQTSHDTSYYFEPIENIALRYPDPMGATTTGNGRDFGLWSSASESQNMANRVRVTGGIDDSGNVDDEQLAVDSYATVTSSSPIWTQVDTRKSELTSILIYTYGGNVSEDGVRVRLQASNSTGDAPINPDSEASDIVTGSRRKVALDPDGWTRFNLGSHTIPERNPWLIIDSDGEGGHQIGVSAAGEPAYQALFPKPITAEVSATRSINKYGEHHSHITNESLVSQNAVRDRANAEIAAGRAPALTIGPLSCESIKAHTLRVGDIIELDRPELRASGEFMVTSKDRAFSGEDAQLNASLELMGVGEYV